MMTFCFFIKCFDVFDLLPTIFYKTKYFSFHGAFHPILNNRCRCHVGFDAP